LRGAAPTAASAHGTAPGPAAAAEASGAAARPFDLDAAVRELVPPAYRGDVDAVARALGPLRGFLARHASAPDRETFVVLAGRMGRSVQGDELWVLAPAFVTTELREAFAIAVLIFIPFLVIDLVVGLGLAALGLTSTSPQAIALPLKLLLFVSVDGWRLLIDSLLRGYA
jgi:flagellar biosynthesis protein FliP